MLFSEVPRPCIFSKGTAQSVDKYHVRLEVRHLCIENHNHWYRNVTLGEDTCCVSNGQTPLVLALVAHLRLPNLAAIRQFAAQPTNALALPLAPL